LTIATEVGPSVLETLKKAQAFAGEAPAGGFALLFDKVVYWKEEKRRRRSSSEIARAQSKETLTIGVSVDTTALAARSRAASRV
jgi:hypothetical protein